MGERDPEAPWHTSICGQCCGANGCCWKTVSPCSEYLCMLGWRAISEQMKGQSGVLHKPFGV